MKGSRSFEQNFVFTALLVLLVSPSYAGFCKFACTPLCLALVHISPICKVACDVGCDIGSKHVPCIIRCVAKSCIHIHGKRKLFLYFN